MEDQRGCEDVNDFIYRERGRVMRRDETKEEMDGLMDSHAWICKFNSAFSSESALVVALRY
jgi:hypothetical protein